VIRFVSLNAISFVRLLPERAVCADTTLDRPREGRGPDDGGPLTTSHSGGTVTARGAGEDRFFRTMEWERSPAVWRR